MSSDSSYNNIGSNSRRASTKSLLFSELNKLKNRLIETPYPYCELDCPWLLLCKHLQSKHSLNGCLLSDLYDLRLWNDLTMKNSEIISK